MNRVELSGVFHQVDPEYIGNGIEFYRPYITAYSISKITLADGFVNKDRLKSIKDGREVVINGRLLVYTNTIDNYNGYTYEETEICCVVDEVFEIKKNKVVTK